MSPGAERNLSGWLVREAVSEMSAAREGRGRERENQGVRRMRTGVLSLIYDSGLCEK